MAIRMVIMSFIDRCPECRHRFYWRLPLGKSMQCPACKVTLVERRRYNKLDECGRNLALVAQVFLAMMHFGNSWLHGWRAGVVVALFLSFLSLGLAIWSYAIFFEDRYEPAGENVNEKQCQSILS